MTNTHKHTHTHTHTHTKQYVKTQTYQLMLPDFRLHFQLLSYADDKPYNCRVSQGLYQSDYITHSSLYILEMYDEVDQCALYAHKTHARARTRAHTHNSVSVRRGAGSSQPPPCSARNFLPWCSHGILRWTCSNTHTLPTLFMHPSVSPPSLPRLPDPSPLGTALGLYQCRLLRGVSAG